MNQITTENKLNIVPLSEFLDKTTLQSLRLDAFYYNERNNNFVNFNYPYLGDFCGKENKTGFRALFSCHDSMTNFENAANSYSSFNEPQCFISLFDALIVTSNCYKQNNMKQQELVEILVPFLQRSLEYLAKYCNSQNYPKVIVAEDTENIFLNKIIIFDFENCMDWLDSRTQRYMVLKFIRASTQYLYSFRRKKENIEEIFNSDIDEFYKEVFKYIIGASEVKILSFIYKNMLLLTAKKGYANNLNFLNSLNSVYSEALRLNKLEMERIQKEKEKKYPLNVWSRHPSHRPLRGMLVSHPTLIRFGTKLIEPKNLEADAEKDGVILINRREGVLNSSSKFRMKECFEKAGVQQADWCIPKNQTELLEFSSKFNAETKFIIKSEFGSRGEGLFLVNNKEELLEWFSKPFKSIDKEKYSNYLVEKYYSYSREYRLHITQDGCFYTCRKMLKNESEERWYRNDDNSVWILEENQFFQKPVNWEEIVKGCVLALNSVGLDFGALDIRVQSVRDKKEKIRENPQWFICEINSAPGLGAIGLEKYKEQIHKIIDKKAICVE